MNKRPPELSVENKLLPLLPDWIKEKIIKAYPLDDCCNTCMGDCLTYNYVLVLPIGNGQEITFSILNNTDNPEKFKKDLNILIDVYKDMLEFYEKFGKPLNIISLDTDDFGMYLPDDFYSENLYNIDEDDSDDEDDYGEFNEQTIELFIKNLTTPRYSKMHLVEEMINNTDDLDEGERTELNTYYHKHLKDLNESIDKLNDLIPTLKHEYFVYPVWDSIDIYMSERYWKREFCIKWKIDEDINDLKKFDELRPLIDSIIEKTKYCSFAIGVKYPDEIITPCDYVSCI